MINQLNRSMSTTSLSTDALMVFGTTTGPRKRLIFETPPLAHKIFLEIQEIKLKFWPEDLSSGCHFCSEQHPPIGACALVRRADGSSWGLENYGGFQSN